MSQAQGLLGERLGSFRLEEVLGSGAMGVVYRGVNEKNGRVVAIKVVSPEFSTGGKIHERFEREAEILQQFRHPNIVRFLAVGRFRGTSYFAMELIQGKNLEKIIQERGPLPWREVVDLGLQTCEALHYAHERGVVHRDLKPSNLMVTSEGRIKLTDFGIAKDLDKTALTATGRTLGTAAYMAPEQIRGTPAVSHKTDLYAFGVVLYQLLVGKPPFEGNTAVVLMHCHLNEPPPRPSAKIHDIPRALDDLVVALMAKAPADRPWDGAAVAATLEELKKKADKNEPVPMVWAAGDARSAEPARASREASPTKTRTKKTSGSRKTARTSAGNQDSNSTITRARLETALLVAGLLLIGGFITYWVWPPSAEYLYHKAETLMASSRHADWLSARDEYIEPLDHRFPDNPYRDTTRAWRDKILLYEAEGRARVLTSGLNTTFSKPADEIERQFVIAHELAKKASERNDDLAAIRHWNDLGNAVKPDDPDQRRWYLLAQERAKDLMNAIADRRKVVEKQVETMAAEFQAGRTEAAQALREKLYEQYSKFTDLADIFPPLPPRPPSGEAPPEGDSNPPPAARDATKPPASSTPDAPPARAEEPASAKPKTPETDPGSSQSKPDP